MRIPKHQPRFNLARATNQFPWDLTKMIQLKRRKWARYQFNRRSLLNKAQGSRVMSIRFFRSYKTKTRQLFRRYFAPQLTIRQCNKLFRSNPRYKASFRRVLQSEYRIDTLVYRLYTLPNVGVARDLIGRGLFKLNGFPVVLPKIVLGIGDMVEPATNAVWDAMYQNLISNIASTTKYYSRIFFKFSFPFVLKRRTARFKETRRTKGRLFYQTPLARERITQRAFNAIYPRVLLGTTKSITRPIRGIKFLKYPSTPVKTKRLKDYYFKRVKLRTDIGLVGPISPKQRLTIKLSRMDRAWGHLDGALYPTKTPRTRLLRNKPQQNGLGVSGRLIKVFLNQRKRRHTIIVKNGTKSVMVTKTRPYIGPWRQSNPQQPTNPWQWKRINSKHYVLFRYLKKFNNRYGIYARYAKLQQVSWRDLGAGVWQKTNNLYEKKKRRLLSLGITKGIVYTAKPNYNTEVINQARANVSRQVLRIKRKYLRLKGFHAKLGAWVVRVDLNHRVYEPIQITYKQIKLTYKHRPIAYYFAEMNYQTLDFCIVSDVDLLSFPYRTMFDFKSLPR